MDPSDRSQADEQDIEIDPKDLRVDVWLSNGWRRA